MPNFFKVVPSDLPQDLTLASASVTDIQLVQDSLAHNPIFTHDKSRVKAGEEHVYTYVSLSQEISPDEMERLRRSVNRLLTELCGGLPILWFFTGVSIAHRHLEDSDARIVMECYHEDLGMNGRLAIVAGPPQDVSLGTECLGYFDSVRGVAATSEGLRAILEKLHLAEPVPTTDSSLTFMQPKYQAIRIVLEHGSCFFEELGNGTRLRIVSNRLGGEQVRSALARLQE